MRKFLCLAFALCFCLSPVMTAYAGAGKYIITISPPSDVNAKPAYVTIRLEDMNETGFDVAQAKFGEDGEWQDITESLSRNGWALLEIDRSGIVYVTVTDPTGTVYIKSQQIDYSGEAGAAQPENPQQEEEPETPEPPGVPDRSGQTPTDGAGTVVENSVKTPGEREFFTITTERGNDFYIVVDKEKSDKNVYLLSEVTEEGLLGLTKPSSEPAAPIIPVPPVTPEPEPEEPEEPPPPEPKSKSNSGMFLIIAAVLICGGLGYYFKIVRPKQYAAENDGDYSEEDEDDDYGHDEDAEYDLSDDEPVDEERG